METSLALSLAALAALIPATVLPYRHLPSRNSAFWLFLGVAVAGPLLWIWVSFSPGWQTGLASALWVTVAASLLLFAILSATVREVWRLAPLLLPYLLVIGVMATLWLHRPGHVIPTMALSSWVEVHIAVSIVTYALLTIGAIAGFAVMLQERALKTKRPTRLTRILPSVADGEAIQVRLLLAGALILGVNLLSGMAAQYFLTGELLALNHKVAFSLVTFVIIVGLLMVHALTGIRGRRTGRAILAAYLFITLAYPGVKFVTDVILT